MNKITSLSKRLRIVVFTKTMKAESGNSELTYRISYGVSIMFREKVVMRALRNHASLRFGKLSKAETESNRQHLHECPGLVVGVYKQRNGRTIRILMMTPKAKCWVILPEEWKSRDDWPGVRKLPRLARASVVAKPILWH